jgi:hypothetical protein
MGALERVHDGLKDFEDLLWFGTLTLPFDRLQGNLEVTSFEQFHHQEVSMILGPPLIEDAHCGRSEQRGHGPSFSEHAFAPIWIGGNLVAQHLDGHRFVVGEISSTVDDPLSS